VLTTAQQNQINTGVPVAAGTAERDGLFGGSGEKTLAEGQLVYVESLDVVQFYNGSVWSTLGPTGLVLISSTTIGTTVSTVTVSNAFSATYDNYLITITGGVASTTNYGDLQLGSTTTGYYMSTNYMTFNANTVSGISRGNQAKFIGCFVATTATIDGAIFLHSPFLAKNTVMHAHYAQATAAGENGTFRGYLDDTTSYTAFTLTASTGTWTGGQIRVYGMRN
jgi:hypothetical protein